MSEHDTTSNTGRQAEDLAAKHLAKQGLDVIARNYRCRGGEIDLICRDGKALVFVEVRLRRSSAFGGAGASITPAKQRRVALAAAHYLQTQRQENTACRFDCILLDALDTARIDWIRDAFST